MFPAKPSAARRSPYPFLKQKGRISNEKIDDQIAEGEKVATRWTAGGTHSGSLLGIPPTGKTVKVTGVNVARFEQSKIAESWFNFDMLSLLQQIGAVPAPGQGGA